MKRRGGGYLGKLGLIVLCLVVLLATAEAQTPAPGAGMPSPAATPATTGPAESEGTYVVKKGDTLWGIAKSLLNDPVLWPQIRERNPFITDPNRIFPGDTLAIPGREPAPQAQVPVAEAPKPEPPKEAPKEEVKAPAPAPPPAPAAPETILTRRRRSRRPARWRSPATRSSWRKGPWRLPASAASSGARTTA